MIFLRVSYWVTVTNKLKSGIRLIQVIDIDPTSKLNSRFDPMIIINTTLSYSSVPDKTLLPLHTSKNGIETYYSHLERSEGVRLFPRPETSTLSHDGNQVSELPHVSVLISD